MKFKYTFIALFLLVQSILALAVPIADFNVVTNCGSGSVQFNDLSDVSSVNANWNFGNGVTLTTVSGSSPVIVYSKPGMVTVTLTSTDGGGISDTKIMNVFVPATPNFSYGAPSICLGTELAIPSTYRDPTPNFSGLNGEYTLVLPGLESYFDPLTGRITYDIGITSATYQFKYSYTAPGCAFPLEYTTTLGIGNASIGPFSGNVVQQLGVCNRILLIKSTIARGALQWQISNSTTGNVFVNLPSGPTINPGLGSFSNPNNISSQDNFFTPTITITSIIRLKLSDPYCGVLDNSTNDQLFTVAGLTKAGIASTVTPITCQNYSPIISLTGYLGQVTWQYSTDGLIYNNSSGTNAFVAQTIPGVVGSTFNTIYSSSPSIFNTTGNFFFKAKVNYTQYGVLGSCEDIYSNVVTITSQFCTVTSAIVNTTTSPICLSQATIPGVLFGSLSTITGTVASITGWRWSFGSGAVPATAFTTTPTFPLVRYADAVNPTKFINLTVTGTGFIYITQTTIQVDAFSVQTGIGPPISNLTICSGSFVTLSVNSSNVSPNIQWQSSPDGILTNYFNVTTSGNGETTRQYTTPGLSNTVFYRATVKNGVCPMVTTTGRSLTVIQPLTINPNLNQPTVTICQGNNTVLTASGSNGDIDFLASPTFGGIYNTVTGTYLSAGVFQTDFFVLTGSYFFKARIANVFNGCSQALSGIYMVSVVSCPILANFTSSGAVFTNKACINNSNFTFTDITPTIAGVKFVKWDWDFGSNASLGFLSTTVGNATKTNYTAEGVQTVNLTITAVAGATTYTGASFLTLTVDGLSNASSITATDNPICVGTTAGLSFISTNTNPSIYWQQSVTGWNTIANATTTSFLTSPLLSTTGFRAVVTNGVCSSVTSSIVVAALPSPVVNLLSANVLTVCSGGQRRLSITGSNFSSIDWLEATVPGFVNFDTVTVGTGTHALVYTTDYLYTGSYYFIAQLNSLTCSPEYSQVITVTSFDCPISPVISVTSAYFAQRTCNDKPSFTFKDITPTISGVRFVRWDWDFDSEGSLVTQSNTSSLPVIPIDYTFPSPLFTNTIKLIQLSITGVSGSNTFTGVSSVLVTIDGVPTVSGFTSLLNNVCTGNSGTGLFFTSSNPTASSTATKWFQSTVLGGVFDEFTPTNPSFHNINSITGTTSYQITATNGICPVFTTPSLLITFYAQPEISLFTYSGNNFCNNQITPVAPILIRTGNSIPGIYFVSSANSNQLSVNASTGEFVPNASILTANEEIFSITYSIPGLGSQCQPRVITRQVDIGKKFATPVFFYNSAPYCTNQGIATRVFNSGEGIAGGFYTSNNVVVNPLSGNVDLSVITASGVHDVTFIIPAIAGCPTVAGIANLTVTSAPTDFSFAYNKQQYCSDEELVTISSAINVDDPFGFWTLTKTNPLSEISIESTTGTVFLTSLTSTDFYTVSYTKPAREGCFSPISKSQYFFITQLPKTPVFDYGSPAEFCSSNSNITVVSSVNNINGSFITDEVDIFVNGSTGRVTTPINTISGFRFVKYIIPPAGACLNQVVGTAQINFIKSYEPIFAYDKSQICNSPTYELSPVDTFDIGLGSGTFYSNQAGLLLNSITGVITITSATVQSNYAIYYRRPKPAICGVGDEVSKIPASLFVEALPPTPIFKYNDFPICSNSSIVPVVISNLLNHVFAAPSGFSINPNTGELFPSNVPEGQYVISVTNRSLLPSSVTTITCPLVSSFATVTVGSNINIPPFNYGVDKFCSDDSTSKNIVGVTLTGGVFSSNIGLDLNTLTGSILISTSSIGSTANSYTISYRIDRQNGCPPIISSTGITIYKKQTFPSFSYPRLEFCSNEINPLPSGSFTDGYFQSPTDIYVNSITGEVDLQNSEARRNIEIRYIIPSNPGCVSIFGKDIIAITRPDNPILTYGNSGICSTADDPYPFLAFPINGTFTGFGVAVHPDSGRVYLAQSQRGISQIYYATPPKGACAGQSTFYNITINSPISTPVLKYIGSPFCHAGTAIPLGSFQFGTFRATSNIEFISSISGLTFKDTIAGEIDLQKSIPGEKYVISYVVPSIGGCDPITVQDTLSIRSGEIGEIARLGDDGIVCSGETGLIELTSFKGTLTWQQRRFNDSTWREAAGDFENKRFTTRELNDTTYFRAKANYNNCPDSVYSNTIKIKVNQGPKSGTATSNENTSFKEICNELSTELALRDYVGHIRWQFSKDSLFWDDVNIRDTVPILTTPSQNEYGLKIWYRASVTNYDCPADYSNYVLVKVCDKVDFIPNVLSPVSGEASLSTWDIRSLKLRDFAEVRIFNRYGSQVYFANGAEASSRPWDGGGLPAGTYYYVIDRKDQSIPLVGSISIVK